MDWGCSRGGKFGQLLSLLAWMVVCLGSIPVFGQTPLSNLVVTVGTTIQTGGTNFSYVLIGAPEPILLAGKRFAIFGKPGFPTNTTSFTLRGTIFQQSDPNTINNLLNQSLGLGEDFNALSTGLNTLLHNVPGITGQTLAQKVVTAFQVAATDPTTAQFLTLLTHINPGLTLCAGQAFSEPIGTTTTYEVRESNLATGAAGEVLGRVTITPGQPVVLPAPGFPFQVKTNAPSDNLRIRLRWGTPPALRRLALLGFGYNLWRIPFSEAVASGYNLTPPTLNQLHTDPHFTLANSSPVIATKDFLAIHGSGGADDPSDNTTYFFSDSNGRSLGSAHFPTNPPPGYLAAPFNDGDQFYYFVTARDVLGRDGLASPGGIGEACRRLQPQAPGGVRVQNNFQVATLAGVRTNLQRLLVSWQQDFNTNDFVTEYWVYRWPNPSMALTNDLVPLSNRVGVVTQVTGTNTGYFLDTGANGPVVPGLSNYWYTIRAVSQGACGPSLSPQSMPAWGVLRERFGPAGATGDLLGSCGVPAVRFVGFTTITNSGPPDTNHWNYRFNCLRRQPGVAWVQFIATNQFGGTTVLGPIYFPPDGNLVQVNQAFPISGTNDLASLACVIGTYYGQVSQPATGVFTTAPANTQQLEADFDSGELLLTAVSLNDPLLATLTGGATDCLPAFGTKAYPDGTVRARFDVGSGVPLLIQAEVNSNPLIGPTWSSLGVFTPDASGFYWVPYPACLVEPLPPFRGCRVSLPGPSDCVQHVTSGGNGPVAPIQIGFVLTPRTHEYRLYRSVDNGPLTLIARGGAVYDPSDPGRTLVRTDDSMPPSAARLCYYVQLLDEHGNGSPMVLIGCKEVTPPKPPRPVLAAPQVAGDTNSPQVALNWFCPTSGVARFQIMVQRADHPKGGLPLGFHGLGLISLPSFNSSSQYMGLLENPFDLAQFDAALLTPPANGGLGPGPQFTTTANVLLNVPYHISVAAVDEMGNTGDPSQVWTFTWKPTNALPTVPWPARPLPPVQNFDDVQPPGYGPYNPRVAAVLMYDSNGQLDQLYPVGIRIGNLRVLSTFPAFTVGTTNLVSYQVPVITGIAVLPPPPTVNPDTLIFTRTSTDPTRNGQLLLPIVVYRQQVANAAFPRVSGSLTQVTPLIETLPHSAVPVVGTSEIDVTIYDRLIAAGYEVVKDITGYYLYLRDQQPVILGASYQYFVVRLDEKREVSEIIPAGTVTLPAP